MPQFNKLGARVAFSGSLIQVAVTQFEGPGGEVIERDVVHHPGAVVVVPVTAERNVVMVRQFRAAVEGDLLEVPAGKRDVEGEPTEVTAARELAEEVGLAAERIELMANFYNSPGFTDEYTWLYLATGLSPVPTDRQGAEEMAMSIEEVPIDDVTAMIADGRIVDAKSVIGLLLAVQRGM